MFLLLLAATGIYLLLGDVHEAMVLGASIAGVIAITVTQERKAERALEALRDLSSPRAMVLRDGERKRIAGRDVVRGDLLILAEGDRVPADAKLLAATDMTADESLLTGESLPVDKRAGDAVFSGTLLVRGQGRAEVTATGPRSEFGRIGASLATLEPGKTALERETARIVRLVALFAVALSLALMGLYALDARRLAGRRARRPDACHGDPARRVPGGAHGVPRPRRLAHLAARRAHAAHAGDRDAGRRHRAVRGQDRHAHREPHGAGGHAAGGGGYRLARLRVGPVRPDGEGDRRRGGSGRAARARGLAPGARLSLRRRLPRGVPRLALAAGVAARRHQGCAGDGARAVRAHGRDRGGAPRRGRGPAPAGGGRGGLGGPVAGGPAALCVPLRRIRAADRSAARLGGRGGGAVPARRDPRGDDHRRLPRHRAAYRAPGGHRGAARR